MFRVLAKVANSKIGLSITELERKKFEPNRTIWFDYFSPRFNFIPIFWNQIKVWFDLSFDKNILTEIEPAELYLFILIYL